MRAEGRSSQLDASRLHGRYRPAKSIGCAPMRPERSGMAEPPILRHKHHRAPSVFTPDDLLREARRQKKIAPGAVPEICVLDPDGDILRHLLATGLGKR